MFCQSLSFLSRYKTEAFLPFTLSGPQENHLWSCAITYWSLYGNFLLVALCLSLVQLSFQPLRTMAMSALQYKVSFSFSLSSPSTAMPIPPSLCFPTLEGRPQNPAKSLFCALPSSPQQEYQEVRHDLAKIPWFSKDSAGLPVFMPLNIALCFFVHVRGAVFLLTLGIQELGQGQQGKIADKK